TTTTGDEIRRRHSNLGKYDEQSFGHSDNNDGQAGQCPAGPLFPFLHPGSGPYRRAYFDPSRTASPSLTRWLVSFWKAVASSLDLAPAATAPSRLSFFWQPATDRAPPTESNRAVTVVR